MGFLDKVKAQAEQVAKQGQEKLDDMQAKRKADGLLRDLGAWYYATQTGRDNGAGPEEMGRIVADLQAHEAEHGPLGAAKDEEEPPAPPVTPPPPPGSIPPPPPPAVPGPDAAEGPA